MTSVNIQSWELHNLEIKGGRTRLRPGLQAATSTSGGSEYCAGFSVESPSTGEVWHYLVERATATGVCQVKVYTEQFVLLYSYGIGPCAADMVVSYALNSGQIIINSPSMSAPLFGIVGGGLTTAVKVTSENPDTTALQIPTGHTCSFGDRVAIAQGRTVYFSDPGNKCLTYVAENTWTVEGQILDLLVGDDGALYAFTTKSVYVLPADALGKGQQVVGFTSVLPGIFPARSLNAAVSNGQIGVLTENGILFIGKDEVDIGLYDGRRYYSQPIEIDDYRVSGQLFATPDGFAIGLPGSFFMVLVSRSGQVTFVWTQGGQPIAVVGTLRGRDGEVLYVVKNQVLEPSGSLDFNGAEVQGVACGELAMSPDAAGVVRSVTLGSDSVGEVTLVFAGGQNSTSTTASRLDDLGVASAVQPDTLIGTSLWNTTVRMSGRSLRTTLHRVVVRDGDPQIEVGTNGSGRRLDIVDVSVRGQSRKRRDKYR